MKEIYLTPKEYLAKITEAEQIFYGSKITGSQSYFIIGKSKHVLK